jgi:nucleoside-diphosphate-sugar epimerase
MTLNCSKIFVLGASGFIGGRLVEKLYMEHNHVAKCLVRNCEKMVRIARFPVDIVYGDVLAPETLEGKIDDCDIYVFCVHGKDKNHSLSWRVNTEGLKNMLNLAISNKAKQFIFLSTTAIYENQYDEGEFDESMVPSLKKRNYAHGKLEGERICLEYSKKYNLNVTILRPTIVYGPFAPSWTIYPAELARQGILKEYDRFDGICNIVYVDDVVDVITKCIMNKKSFNDIFIVSSGETMTWKRFFNAFSLAITGKPMEKSSRVRYLTKSLPLFVLKRSLKLGIQLMPEYAKKIYGYVKSKGSGDWSWVKGQDVSTIKLNFFKKKLVFKIDKLKTKLDFEPQYNFDMGFRITSNWLKHHRYTIID